MKNSNLLNRLLSYSHEKQSPQRFARYAAMLIMLLTIGVGQMWAVTVNGGKFYFDATSFTTTDAIQLAIWKCGDNDKYSEYFGMTRIDNTKLYQYCRNGAWGGAWYIAVIGNTSSWGSGSHCATVSNASSYTNAYNADYTFNSGDSYYLTSSANTGGTLTPTSGVPDKTQTVYAYVNGEKVSKTPANIQINSYYRSGWGATNTDPLTVSTSTVTTNAGADNSTTYTCIVTARTTLSVSNVSSGYYFVGWYTSGGDFLSSNTSYEYYASTDNEIHARFETRYDITVNANANGTITTPVGGSGSTVTAGYYTSAAIAASANTGYYFTGWSRNNNNVTIANSSSASTSVTATGTATVTAGFSPMWAVVGGNSSSSDGSDAMGDWSTTANEIQNITTPEGKTTGYVDITLEANTTYYFKMYNNSLSGTPAEKYWSYNGGALKMVYPTDDNKVWQLYTGNANSQIVTAGKGSYRFTWNSTDHKLTVDFPTSYSVTFGHGTGGSTVTASGSVSGSITTGQYVASGENVTFTQTPAAGYSFKEWNTQADGNGTTLGTGASLTLSSIGENKNVYAIYTPNTYTVTFDINGGDTWANDGTASVSGGGVRSMTMTYDASVSGTCPTPVKNGYVFKCWSTDPDLWEGNYLWQYDGSSFGWYYPAAYADYISTAGKWKKASDVTLYAHYYPVSIMAVDFSPRHVVPEGEVTATVRFNPFLEGSAPTYNPEGDYTLCYTLTTSAGTALQAQPTWDQDDAALTVTFTAPGSPGEYTLDVKLLAGTGTDCDETPIEDYQAAAPYTFEVEEMNSVTVSFKCGSADVSEPTTARATWSNPATVTAPTIPGLQFVNWTYTGGVSLVDGYENTNNPVQIKAISSGTLTANYSQGSLFFKDTKGWGQVYIYFYNSTGYLYENNKASEGTGSSADWKDTKDGNNKPFISGPHAMTLLEGTTDVYYYPYDFPEGTVSFVFTKESLSGQSYFAGPNTSNPCSVVRVAHSINPDKPMIVPVGDGALWNLDYARYYGHDEAPILTDWGYNLRGAFNEWSSSKSEFKAPTLGSLTFTTTAYLDAGNANYAWKVYNGNKGYGKGGDPVLTKSSPTSATLISADAAGNNLQVKSNIAGEYTFTLNYGIGTGTANTNGASLASTLLSNMTVTVTYPVVAGDYRLIYTGGTNPHPGNVIKKRADGEDIVSMYVASGKADKIKIHACTATDNTSVTWGSTSDPTYGTDVYTAFTALLESEGSGVYNFYITQDASGNPTITNVEKYTGRFYVRTNCVNEDKWNYRDSKDAHAMTYSEWSATKMENTDMRFSHYFVDDLHGTSVSPINIRFTVATDYSEAICDTVFAGDADGKWKDYIHSENLSQTANVRFTYDQNRNKIWRAYTEGPENDDYMVLRSNGTDIFEANSDGTNSGTARAALKFVDQNNWVYQIDAYAYVNSYIKLTAEIADVEQYLRGNAGDGAFDEDDAELLLSGNREITTAAQHMRITYDFKTDRMMISWLPSGPVEGTLDIDADIMLLRREQEGATSITFSTGGKLEDVKTAYGVMEFRKSYIHDYSLSRYARNLYWISFPFDVNLSDVFGFGKYGEHWIIEYYDGKGRAEKGYWADSEPNWKFVTEEVKDEFVLKANEGYILALALSNMTEYSDIWANSVTSVYLYFPSANEIGNLSNVSSVTVKMDTVGFKCKITRDNRHIKDSYWRCIGVPSYALSTRTGLPTSAPDNWETKVPYVYIWNSINNSLAITSNDEVNFEAMHSYLIQYPDDEMVWTNVTNVPAGVMRRRVEGREAGYYEWNLNLLRNGEHQDHTYVRLSNDENVTDGYDFGNDLSKEFNSGSNIYTFVDDVEVAGNVKPIRTETTIVPVGVKIATTGEYTFSMPEGTNGVGVILVDNITGTRTNLALEDYTVNLTQGNIDGRFLLEISPIAQTTTDMENVQGDDVQTNVRKVMVDGILYIVKDGKVFDAQGNRVR